MCKKVTSGKKIGRVISGRENGEKSGEARRTFGQQSRSGSKQGARGAKKFGQKVFHNWAILRKFRIRPLGQA